MIGWQQKSPVALLIFNRPDKTEAVFQTIRNARPPKLLVVADGPRADRPDEAEKCAGARAIVDRVDWNCEVLTNYSDVNLGCKRRIASGLDWVFSEVEEAILLEDDCVPHPTFFRYCDELLERYRDDERIMTISGDKWQADSRETENSYYFSRYAHAWGWASWRRAWKYYDVEMEHWPRVRDGGWLEDILHDPGAVRYWRRILQATYEGRIDTWDNQWTLSCWLQSGLHILPNVNLVSNIGFGSDSTHTFSAADPLANLPTAELDFPLRHPPFIIQDTVADDIVQRTRFDRGKSGLLGPGGKPVDEAAFRRAKARAEVQGLRAERLERRLGDLREQNRREVQKLRGQHQRRIERLTRRLAKTKKRARNKNRVLTHQLRSIQASRTWRLINKLGEIRARVLGRKR